MSKIKYNKSKTYLLPLLSEFVKFDKKFIPFLENTYLFDDKNKYNNCIYILHDFNFKNPEFTKYEYEFTNNELYVNTYDFNNQSLYVFNFPKEYLNEYNYLINSEYSKYGDDAKKMVLKFWSEMYGNTPEIINYIKKFKQILYKEVELRKEIEKKLKVKIHETAELGEFVDINNETFSFEKYEYEYKHSKVK